MTTAETRAGVRQAIHTLRIPATPEEYDLHHMIKEALGAAGIEYEHEAPIGARARIDFLVGDVGIEIKRGKQNTTRLRAQLTRYAASERIAALIVVTTRLANVPGTILGKPVEIIGLHRLWGVSLP